MTDKYDKVQVTGGDEDVVRVLKDQDRKTKRVAARLIASAGTLDLAIAESEAELNGLGQPLPGPPPARVLRRITPPQLRPWRAIAAEAETTITGPVGLVDLLTNHEIEIVESRIGILRGEFDARHRLDATDWTIAGVAGSLAALVDAFLVTMPSSPGMLGGSPTRGGALSNYIREKLRTGMDGADLRELERTFPVPYDAPHSKGLNMHVRGLGPRTHRFQSFGHDPVLGFLFGTLDILTGSMTAVDSSGHLITQATKDIMPGATLFEAIGRQLGHLVSDVGTRAGLPAPLMPLLQLLQAGHIGDKGRSIGQVARLMYVKGYDFGHFMAMSVCPLVIEAVVRVSYAAKGLLEGRDVADCVPIGLPGKPSPPKLNTMLFTAHLIATAANSGRVYLSSNPLTVNQAEWMAFTRYAISQLQWGLFDKEADRLSHVQGSLDEGWAELSSSMDQWWRAPTATDPEPIRLGEGI